MKGVKVIAWVQIVLSVVFVCTALKVQQAPTSLLDRYADACQDMAGVVRKHNTEVYQPIMQNIFTMRTPLRDIGGKVENLASVMASSGAALQKYRGARWHSIPLYPDCFAALGRTLQTTGESIGQSGELLIVQAEIIGNYQEGIYGPTVQTLESIAANLDHTARELRQFEMRRSPFVFSVMTVGVIFFLNGIALLIMAGAVRRSCFQTENQEAVR